MNKTIKFAVAAAFGLTAAQAFAQITFYEADGWRGRASSVVVERGQWEVCEDANFRGQCMVLRRGSYETLSGMGLNNRISSVRSARPSSAAGLSANRSTNHRAPTPAA